jgi:hypothetical protein
VSAQWYWDVMIRRDKKKRTVRTQIWLMREAIT